MWITLGVVNSLNRVALIKTIPTAIANTTSKDCRQSFFVRLLLSGKGDRVYGNASSVDSSCADYLCIEITS